jgi:hypothetical protein
VVSVEPECVVIYTQCLVNESKLSRSCKQKTLALAKVVLFRREDRIELTT